MGWWVCVPFFFLEYLQENEPLCCGPVNIHISFSPFIRGLMRINVCWIESVTPRLDTQGDWTGISSLKRSARIQTAASGSSALCISNRTKWGEMASLWTFSVETHQKSEQETCFPTRVKYRRVSPASAFWEYLLLVPFGLTWVSLLLVSAFASVRMCSRGILFCYSSLMLCPLLGLLSYIFVILYPRKFVKNLLIFASPYLKYRHLIIHCSKAQHTFCFACASDKNSLLKEFKIPE